MPHILVAGRIHQAGIDRLKSARGITFRLVEDNAADAYVPFMAEADALLVRTQPLTADIVSRANALRIVSRHGVGYDAIDVAALNARNIPLAIVGDVNSRAVAEHTLMLMLASARCAVAHDAASRSGNWQVRNRFETVELDGKRLLLVGLGRIGRRVAQLAQAFGMSVMAHDPFVSPEAMRAVGVEALANIEEGLKRADYVSLHVPLSPDGAVIGDRQLALMKPTAIIINAARGGLIDEMALDSALRQGRLYAAGLDVLQDEPPKPDNPLLGNGRVTISPHSAGLTEECAARMGVAAVQNILDCFAGTLDPALVVNARAIGLAR